MRSAKGEELRKMSLRFPPLEGEGWGGDGANEREEVDHFG